jgi:hypothetical protein
MGRAAFLLVITELRKSRSRNVQDINALKGSRVPAFARYRWSDGSETDMTLSNSVLVMTDLR